MGETLTLQGIPQRTVAVHISKLKRLSYVGIT